MSSCIRYSCSFIQVYDRKRLTRNPCHSTRKLGDKAERFVWTVAKHEHLHLFAGICLYKWEVIIFLYKVNATASLVRWLDLIIFFYMML
jgi:hypothetical protein